MRFAVLIDFLFQKFLIFLSFFLDKPLEIFPLGTFESTDIVFAKRREMRDRLGEIVSQKPPVGEIGFDFLDGLMHATDAEQILDEHHFDENNGIDAQVILRNQFVQRNDGKLVTAFGRLFSQHVATSA